MSNQIPMTNDQSKPYNLEERTAQFGEAIIVFIKKLPRTIIFEPLISQLIRSATSVGANYCEADCAETKKDFQHKIGICKKESRETQHWLRMIAEAVPEVKEECRKHWKEVHELNLIFCAIVNSSKHGKKD